MTRPDDLDLEGEIVLFHKPRTALILIFTGTLSAFGSYLVIRELWVDFDILPLCFGRKRAKSRSVVPNSPGGSTSMRASLVRALMAISLVDLVSSLAFALTTVPSPSWTPHVPYASGNTATCEAQAFFLQLGNVAAPLFSTFLTFLFLAILNLQWTDDHIQKVEIWAHGLIWFVALACASFPIPLDLYNNAYHMCWINSYPEGCDYKADFEGECERGADSVFYSTLFTVFPLWPSLLVVTILMCMVYSSVRRVEQKSANVDWGERRSNTFRSSGPKSQHQTENTMMRSGLSTVGEISEIQESSEHVNDENDDDDSYDSQASSARASQDEGYQRGDLFRKEDRKKSKAVARQAFLFVVAFVLTHILRLFATLWWTISEEYNAPLYVLAYDVMLPLQGWFNALVLLRTKKLHTPEGVFVEKLLSYLVCKRFSRRDAPPRNCVPNVEQQQAKSDGNVGHRGGISSRPESSSLASWFHAVVAQYNLYSSRDISSINRVGTESTETQPVDAIVDANAALHDTASPQDTSFPPETDAERESSAPVAEEIVHIHPTDSW